MLDKISIIRSQGCDQKNHIRRLWQECLPGTPIERFEWLASNPHGPAIWFLAQDKSTGDLVGTVSVLPRMLFFNRNAIRAGIVGDIMVKACCRRKGIASRLLQRAFHDLGHKMKFFYAVPNKRSEGLLCKMGLKNSLLLRNFLIPVQIRYYFKKFGFQSNDPNRTVHKATKSFPLMEKMSGYEVEDVEIGLNQELDDLWSHLKGTSNLIIGSRDLSFLRWKYERNPERRFKILKLRDGNRALEGYCIFNVDRRKAIVDDLLVKGSMSCKKILMCLKDYAKRRDYVGIYLCTNSKNPYFNRIWRPLIIRIGGDIKVVYSGPVPQAQQSWLFYPVDRNI